MVPVTLENQLTSWTGPSSTSEQEKQERAERMIRQAVDRHEAFADLDLDIFAKGSYRNNTNVRSDSDVDIAVRCNEVFYWEAAEGIQSPTISAYEGIWTPKRLRQELKESLQAVFPGQVDSSGKVALRVNANSARVDADVVPCFDYRYYTSSGAFVPGTRVFRSDDTFIDNFPEQQLTNGIAKNNRTGRSYKRAVRILKRVENALASTAEIKALPSYFMECLVYNCPDRILRLSTWTDTMRGLLSHIYAELEGSEPETERWMEPNDIKFLFHPSQPWTRQAGRSLALKAWRYWDFD